MLESQKYAPIPTPDTQPYWDAAAQGRLELPKCRPCDAWFFYPRDYCPRCGSADVFWGPVSGRARLLSYVINHRAAPGFEDDTPYAIAIVELDEGPRMMTNIVGVPSTPETLVLDMRLEVVFEQHGEMHVPKFRPVEFAT